MKSKKLLVLLASLAAVIVVIVILAAVFAVHDVALVYHEFDGSQMAALDEGGIAPNDVLKLAKGKSTVFLSKNKLLERINSTYTDWHAFAVVKDFPNKVEIHIVKRTAILKIDVGGKEVYIDSFGYVTNDPDPNDPNSRYIDASSAFKTTTEAKTQQPGQKFEFAVAENNVRLQCILEALIATWQCNVDIPNLPTILAEQNVFEFDEDNNLLIKPNSGGIIKIMSPETNLTQRLIKAYGVYYNEQANVQGNDWMITVRENGTITTPNPDKK